MIYLAFLLIPVIGIFYYNTFAWLVTSWINNSYYSHGFLVPVISGYIIWGMRKELALIEKKQSMAGLALFMTGIIVQGISTLWTIRFLSGISLILAIAGIILYLYGEEFIRKIAFPLFFLLLMVPLPFVDLIAPPIQMISATTSADMANFIGIPTTRDGLVLHIPNGTFEVGLECSGLRSVISLITIAIIFAFMIEGTNLVKFIIIFSSIPLAILGNILRIVSVLGIADIYGQEIAMKYFHDFSSVLAFISVLLGLILIGRCFGRLKFKIIF